MLFLICVFLLTDIRYFIVFNDDFEKETDVENRTNMNEIVETGM